jgi:hypothetical protein
MRKIISLFFVFTLCGALIWPGSASAAIDDQGAAGLKKLVENELQGRLGMTKITGQGLVTEGAVAVTPKPAFYEVKIPGLSLSFGPQGKLDIGMVVINAVPGKAGEWMTSVALPATMTLYEKPDIAVASISLGSQGCKGAWLPAQGIYPRFDCLYKDILIKGTGADDFKIALGSLKMIANLKSNSDGTLSGQGGFEAGDVKIDADGKDALQLNVQKINVTSIYDRLDLSREMEIRKKILDAALTGAPPADEQSAALLGGLMSLTGAMPENLSNSVEAGGIVVRTKNLAQPNQPMEEFSLDKAAFQSTLKNMRQTVSSAAVKGGFNGIKLSPANASLASLMPNALNIDMSMDNIPLKKISAMMYDTLQQMIWALKTTPKSPADAKNLTENQLNSLLASLPRILQNAGASLSIQNTFIKSNEMEAALTGRIQANTIASSGITGKLTLSVNGLENVIQKLQAMAVKPLADGKINTYANGLTALSVMGEADKTADGKLIHNYVFEITDDNKILLNNMNLQPLLAPGVTPQPK